MEVIRPTQVTDAMLVASSADEPETGFPAYSSSSSYADKAHVTVAAVHRRYEAIGAVAAGFYPPDHPEKWLDIGPTNRWAMFDQVVGTATTGTGSITFTLAPGELDSLAVDTDAELINVKLTVSGVEVYNQTQSTNIGGNAILDWKLYFFEPIGRRKQILFLDIPPGYPTGQLTAAFMAAGPSLPVKVGTVSFGRIFFVGKTEQNLKIGITNFSKPAQDEYGVFSLVKRAKARKISGRCMLFTENFDAVNDELTALLDTLCVWIASRSHDGTIVYAFFNDFEIDLTAGAVSFCSLTLQGLT